MASRKRLFYQKKAEPAGYVQKNGTGYEETEMDVDSSDSDVEIGDAVAGLMSMRSSGSSEMYHYVS